MSTGVRPYPRAEIFLWFVGYLTNSSCWMKKRCGFLALCDSPHHAGLHWLSTRSLRSGCSISGASMGTWPPNSAFAGQQNPKGTA